MALTDMNPSSWAGVIGAVGSCLTAVALIITARADSRRSRRLETKVDDVKETGHEVHVMVDGQNTRLQEIVIGQQQQIIALELAMSKQGIALPPTPHTTGEPIVATAVIADKTEEEKD